METLETHDKNGPNDYNRSLTIQLGHIWPELIDTFDTVAIIYAGFNPEYSFFTRKTVGITDQVISEYNNGKRHFIFECLGEGISREVIVKIHRTLDEFVNTHTDATISYVTGASNSAKIYQNICDSENLTPYINMMQCHYLEYIARISYPKYDIDYQIANREKNFLCLNKVHRQHRIDLLELMLREHLINDKCYYSFYDGSNASHDAISRLSEEDYPNIKNNLDLISTLRLNFDDTRVNPVDVRDEDLELFNNSYFSVITETIYHSDNYTFPKAKCHVSDVESGPFVTEKTVKALALKHPFILATVPNTLPVLRDRGYKTFHPFIDETYDSIEDDDLRLEYIINEVKRLSRLSDSEWLEWTRNIKPIVDHNYEVFFNHTVFSY